MAFCLELSGGFFRDLQKQAACEHRWKPFLQVLHIQKMEGFQSSSERFKIVLSDGLQYMQAVLAPRINHLIVQKLVRNQSIVKLLEYDSHFIKGKLLLVILNLEDIVSNFSHVIGAPVSIEKTSESNASSGSSHIRKGNSEPRATNTLSHNLLNLFYQSDFTDITFCLTNGERLKAHKNILSCRSPYFHSLLTCGMQETFASEIPIRDVAPEIFTAVVKFIYSDLICFDADETSTETAWQLFDAGRYYGLDRLMKQCELFLTNECLAEDTATSLWNDAVQFNAPQVAAACKCFYEQHFEAISALESFLELNKDSLVALLQSENLVVSSQDVLTHAIIIWGRAHVSPAESTLETSPLSREELFCMFFPLVRKARTFSQSSHSPSFRLQELVLELLQNSPNGLRLNEIQMQLNAKPAFAATSLEEIRNCLSKLQQAHKISQSGELYKCNPLPSKKRLYSTLSSSPQASNFGTKRVRL